ncbi:Uncharacterised protein r2_g4363 [Pycnogonum litorale]
MAKTFTRSCKSKWGRHRTFYFKINFKNINWNILTTFFFSSLFLNCKCNPKNAINILKLRILNIFYILKYECRFPDKRPKRWPMMMIKLPFKRYVMQGSHSFH